MEDKKIFNLNALVSVLIKDKYRCYDIIYKSYKKGLFRNRKEGFYYSDCLYSDANLLLKKDIEGGTTKGIFKGFKLIIEGNIVYYKPYVQLSFSSGENSKCKEFDTYQEALDFGNKVADEGMSVKIEVY